MQKPARDAVERMLIEHETLVREQCKEMEQQGFDNDAKVALAHLHLIRLELARKKILDSMGGVTELSPQ